MRIHIQSIQKKRMAEIKKSPLKTPPKGQATTHIPEMLYGSTEAIVFASCDRAKRPGKAEKQSTQHKPVKSQAKMRARYEII